MTHRTRSAALTYVVAASSSLLFCSKSIFVKSAYAEGLDTLTVLALRMGMAFPFFLLGGILASRGEPRIRPAVWVHLLALGFLGYYLSSLLDFHGLRFMSVGLERIVLFTYPAFVVLGGVLFLGRRISMGMGLGLALAYGGIFIAFLGEASVSGGRPAIGVGLVLASALCYAIFLGRSEGVVRELGASRFTAIAVGFSCLMILLHYVLSRSPRDLLELPAVAYRQGAFLAIFGTVLPSYLMGLGIRRAGASGFAVISTVGPVGTLVLAWLILGESPSPAQLLGFALSLAGGVVVTLRGKEGGR